MKPELINRFDAILTFRALTVKDVGKIFDNLLDDLKRRLAAKSIGIKISPAVKKHLIQVGFDARNGARPLRRAIEDELESLIADKILDGTLVDGSIANVDLVKKKLTLSVAKE
jgi:ATP-dependent Clp protease ATP-binding subunit ClpC